MYCYKCGKEISETVKFCPHCGTEQGESHRHQNQGKKDSGKKNVGAIIRKILLILIIRLIVKLVMKCIRKTGRKKQKK